MDRRDFLLASAALAVTPSLSSLPSSAHATPSSDLNQGCELVKCTDLSRWDLFIAKDVCQQLFKPNFENFKARVSSLRENLLDHEKIALPRIRVRDDASQPLGIVEYSIALTPFSHLSIKPDWLVVAQTDKVTKPLEDSEDLEWIDDSRRYGWATGKSLVVAALANYQLFHPYDLCIAKLAELARALKDTEIRVPGRIVPD